MNIVVLSIWVSIERGKWRKISKSVLIIRRDAADCASSMKSLYELWKAKVKVTLSVNNKCLVLIEA